MDVMPEIEARLKALEDRIGALEDGQEHLTADAQATGSLAAANEGGIPPASQPGVIPAQQTTDNSGADQQQQDQ